MRKYTINYKDLFSFTVIEQGNDLYLNPPLHKFVWVHGDEITAKNTLLDYLHALPATARYQAFLINNLEQRELEIEGILVDPNRMFTAPGLINNLIELNPKIEEARLRLLGVKLLTASTQLMRYLAPIRSGFLCALHNNFRGYSLQDEIEFSMDIAINQPSLPCNFILCTKATDFSLLKNSKYNVVLNSQNLVLDDGSLGYAMLKQNLRYLNLEVKLGEVINNQAMFSFILNTI